MSMGSIKSIITKKHKKAYVIKFKPDALFNSSKFKAKLISKYDGVAVYRILGDYKSKKSLWIDKWIKKWFGEDLSATQRKAFKELKLHV